ncbi:hypothetical protein MGYG_06866 [Nannizzia gypsea CBS 118893]|uniref:Uncharacterized protein n=1 Tax=Arthroderma gypseum (strain ATCC MYA-4604 / CBS 118893) TaxID=535722 RepID=E4V1F2_ARTGP|nr:hypothetical protein MGYG_06866 [Nannizzia gypsea CBS 118893]EFR03867.1 hypothetical protein MGYG_06866 [Nannizzia gypsea CBS 118893]
MEKKKKDPGFKGYQLAPEYSKLKLAIVKRAFMQLLGALTKVPLPSFIPTNTHKPFINSITLLLQTYGS